MKQVRNMFLLIVINIFLMLLVSVMMEYNNLSQRLSLLENNIDLALDRSIDAATASEELFSEDYQVAMSSHGIAQQGSHKLAVGANITLWGKDIGSWYDVSSYILAMFYADKHKLPDKYSEYKTYAVNKVNTNYVTREVFEWIFGEAGHRYGEYEWCNNNFKVMNALDEANIDVSQCRPTDEFKAFYNNIGKAIVINGVVKQKSGDDFTTEYKFYPVLDNMGLDFGDKCTSENAVYMTDNFCMSEHVGKKVGQRYTSYFLTPFSLGVTYVPQKVLKPVFIANLDTIARLQRASSGGVGTAPDFNSASECVKPTVYVGAGRTQAVHHNKNNHHIVTDGNIEYDLDTVQLKVEYFTADFYKEKYKNIATRIEGSITASDNHTGVSSSDPLARTVQLLQQTDSYSGTSGSYEYKQNATGNRIVAKITIRLKVHILYESNILQWLSYKDWKAHGSTGDWHASIKEINPSTGLVIRDGSDGTWYQTSTYFAVSR